VPCRAGEENGNVLGKVEFSVHGIRQGEKFGEIFSLKKKENK